MREPMTMFGSQRAPVNPAQPPTLAAWAADLEAIEPHWTGTADPFRRFGWNASGRGGRTWCSVRTAPTPPSSGRSQWCMPLKYSVSRPVRMMVFFKIATLSRVQA